MRSFLVVATLPETKPASLPLNIPLVGVDDPIPFGGNQKGPIFRGKLTVSFRRVYYC